MQPNQENIFEPIEMIENPIKKKKKKNKK